MDKINSPPSGEHNFRIHQRKRAYQFVLIHLQYPYTLFCFVQMKCRRLYWGLRIYSTTYMMRYTRLVMCIAIAFPSIGSLIKSFFMTLQCSVADTFWCLWHIFMRLNLIEIIYKASMSQLRIPSTWSWWIVQMTLEGLVANAWYLWHMTSRCN